MNALEELRKTISLETTVVYTGYFLDYWGMPGVKSNMSPITLILDIPNNSAAIPGSGDMPVIFAHTVDVAKFTAASLDLEKWDPQLYVIGDRITWNEFLRLAEKVKGKCFCYHLEDTTFCMNFTNFVCKGTKFKVAHDSVDTLKAGKVTELPGQVAAYPFFPKEAFQNLAAKFGLWFEEGAFNFHPERTLHDDFPEINPMTAAEMLSAAWKKL